ncbi:MAG: hypothetical protein PHG66_01740 [Candidatus Colwellbacteria bacterium]|nr:hypothetical protein [Candidatus Colwellbacteria bacterium]
MASSISFARWLCHFLCVSSDQEIDLAPGLDCLLSGIPDSDVSDGTRRFLEKRFPNISEDKVIDVIDTLNKMRRIIPLKISSSKTSIVCTPVDTNGAQFDDVSSTNETEIIYDEVISPTVVLSSSKKFTFDIHGDVVPLKNLKRVNLIYSSIVHNTTHRLRLKVSLIADREEVSECDVYIGMIRRQLRKDNNLKNKIDMMILRDEYEKLLSSCNLSVDDETKKSINNFIG